MEHEIWEDNSHLGTGNGWTWTIWVSTNISEDQGSSHYMTFACNGPLRAILFHRQDMPS
jgi:hypothetical protein